VALAQEDSSPHRSGGCIRVAWGESSAPGSYSSASKPQATHLDTTPLCNLGGKGGRPCCLAGWLTFKWQNFIQQPGKNA